MKKLCFKVKYFVELALLIKAVLKRQLSKVKFPKTILKLKFGTPSYK